MIEKRALIFFALLCMLFAYQSFATEDCPEGIISYWEFPSTVSLRYQDTINAPDGHDAAPFGEAPTSIGDGAVFQGLRFNGSSQGLVVESNNDFNWSNTDSFSFEFWIKRSAVGLQNTEVILGRHDKTSGMDWRSEILSDGRLSFTLTSVGGETYTVTCAKNITGEVSGSVVLLRWHHVAIIRDGVNNRLTMYVDGIQADDQSAVFTSGFTSATGQLTIGRSDNENKPAWFGGFLDEVAIYNRILSYEELRSHYYLSKRYCSLESQLIRIMPMGNSITFDQNLQDVMDPSGGRPVGLRVGYRQPLWIQLDNAFYRFHFVGSEMAGQDATPAFDAQNAGFPGIRDDELAILLNSGINPHSNKTVTNGPYLDEIPANVVLLHIGTNGISASAADVADILEEIDRSDEKITVLLAKILNVAPDGADSTTTVFNKNVENMALSRKAQGDKIIIVDMEKGAGIDYVNDMMYASYPDDVLHPNPSGFEKMASKWFTLLATFLPQSQLPEIISTPANEIALGQTYRYQIDSTGRPAATCLLVSGPNGMTVDSQSGMLTWVADTSGIHTITVRASNWTGSDEQVFNLTVNEAPTAVPDSYPAAIREGGRLNVDAQNGVLKNDSDNNTGQALTAILVSDVVHGTLKLKADGSFIYQHDGSENFTDTFRYKATDGQFDSNTVTATITIRPENDPPVISGQKDLFTKIDTPIALDLQCVEVTDPDNKFPDDFTLVVQDGVGYKRSGNTITPISGFSGTLTVPVVVNDGEQDSNVFMLTIAVNKKGNGGDPVDGGGGGGGGCFISTISAFPGRGSGGIVF